MRLVTIHQQVAKAKDQSKVLIIFKWTKLYNAYQTTTMKLELKTPLTLSLIAIGSCHAFAPPNTRRRIALSRPGFATPPAAKTLRLATADGTGILGDKNRNADNEEVERLRTMAKQLREEATTLAAEQARKVLERTQKAFSKLDLN
jgi:hypothetical protein